MPGQPVVFVLGARTATVDYSASVVCNGAITNRVDPTQERIAEANIVTCSSQLQSPQPNETIIRDGLSSIRTVVEVVAGNSIAAGRPHRLRRPPPTFFSALANPVDRSRHRRDRDLPRVCDGTVQNVPRARRSDVAQAVSTVPLPTSERSAGVAAHKVSSRTSPKQGICPGRRRV